MLKIEKRKLGRGERKLAIKERKGKGRLASADGRMKAEARASTTSTTKVLVGG